MKEQPEKQNQIKDTEPTHFSNFLKIIWRVLAGDIRSQSRLLSLTILMIILWSAAVIACPILVQAMIDRAIPERNLHLLMNYTAGVLFCIGAATVLFILQTDFAVKASENILYGLRSRLVETILNQSVDFFHHFSPGDLTTRFSNDAEHISESFYEQIMRSLMGIIYPAFLVMFMLAWNWKLGLIALLTIPVYFFYVRIFQSSLARFYRYTKEEMSEQTDVFLDLINGAQEIRAFQQNKSAMERFLQVARRYTCAAIRSMRLMDWTRNGVDMIGLFITYLPVIVGGFLIVTGKSQTLTVGILVAYYMYLRLLTTRLFLIFQGFTKIAAVYPSFARILEILEFPMPQIIKEIKLEDTPADAKIEFRNVHFSYASGKTIFNGLNLIVNAGEKVAIMGPSGSGKSTLLHLLMRFQKVTGGEILFGGKNIDHYPLPFYLTFFSYVSQKTHLFKLSVLDNVSMGWYHVPPELVTNAVKTVRMHETVTELPNGYNTVLSKNGIHLSGGQAQRLALARAMIRTPDILLLDEFTSALDSKNERDILKDLLSIFAANTIICVTHSEDVAANFERVIYLDSVIGTPDVPTQEQLEEIRAVYPSAK